MHPLHAVRISMSKVTVLTFARYYLPGFKAGGPIRTLSNMVEALGDEFDFRIVCSDRDFMDRAAYPTCCLGELDSSRKGLGVLHTSYPVGCVTVEAPTPRHSTRHRLP